MPDRQDVVLVGLVLFALFLGLPLLGVTTFVAYGVSTLLGLPDLLAGILILGVGFGGGLVLLFLILVRLQRRFGSTIDPLLDDPAPPPPPPEHDTNADPATLEARVREADAHLGIPSDDKKRA